MYRPEPLKINKYWKLPNTSTTMPRNTAAGKAAAGPSNTSNGETATDSNPQVELVAANTKIKWLRELLKVRDTPTPSEDLLDRLATALKALA
jgi:hypothetical protein